VILTSGTTGRPKGAARSTGGSGQSLLGLLDVMPLRHGQRCLVAAPLFHAWGWTHFSVGLALRQTCVLEPSGDPRRLAERMVDAATDVLVTVPILLRRLLDADVALPPLRLVALSGSPLPAGLAVTALERLGDVVYNLYGSTEAGWVTVAGPGDLRAAPGTAGRPVPGVRLHVVGDNGADVGIGQVGRVAIESDLTLDEYTDGSASRQEHGLLQLGDLGRLDEAGRLHVVGRADDMVVSGGENVYPSEVEDLLAAHPGITEVAVVGVADEEFGQRLRAVVVPADGASLSAEDVREHVKANLARHKVPRDVVIVEALPRNAAGKVLRRELTDL
jgi:acyl-coenzyme A synthetase/AMP-(fatty) acid ligase